MGHRASLGDADVNRAQRGHHTPTPRLRIDSNRSAEFTTFFAASRPLASALSARASVGTPLIERPRRGVVCRPETVGVSASGSQQKLANIYKTSGKIRETPVFGSILISRDSLCRDVCPHPRPRRPTPTRTRPRPRIDRRFWPSSRPVSPRRRRSRARSSPVSSRSSARRTAPPHRTSGPPSPRCVDRTPRSSWRPIARPPSATPTASNPSTCVRQSPPVSRTQKLPASVTA